MQDAFHNSASRWPPPKCHYDSRQELRTKIIDWGTGRSSDIPQFLLWMHGPFGVGKSAIAQSCAESLMTENKLCASIFFSRPNKRNNPDRVFTSIAYQLAVKFPLIADILDHKVLKDPTVLTASRLVQFDDLLVKPLRQAQNVPIEGWVIVLDGLDEIDGSTAEVGGKTAQAEIIDIVATSIRERTTPFRWFILSRPESHIQLAMSANDVSSLLYSLDLPLSSPDDHDILTFFEKELDKIRKKHNFPSSWCSEADVSVLVKLADGLWVYVDTATRFIGDPNCLGPTAQLNLVLSLAKESRGKFAGNPLARMDMFYDLIMGQIPPNVVPMVRKILLLNHTAARSVFGLANTLGLSQEQFYASCGFLQSVLFLKPLEEPIRYYHSSFMEYMEDPRRSKDFCIYGDVVQELYQEMIQRLNEIHASSKGMRQIVVVRLIQWTKCMTGSTPVVNITFPRSMLTHDSNAYYGYRGLVWSLFSLLSSPNCSVSSPTAAALDTVEFSQFPVLFKGTRYGSPQFWLSRFRENVCFKDVCHLLNLSPF